MVKLVATIVITMISSSVGILGCDVANFHLVHNDTQNAYPNINTNEASSEAPNGDTDMASSGLPDGWELLVGEWGTDIDRDETNKYGGFHSIRMIDTAVATSIATPHIVATGADSTVLEFTPQTTDVWFYIYQPDDGNVLNTFTITAYYYDKAGTELFNYSLFSGRTTTTTKWEIFSAATYNTNGDPGGYTVIRITKAARAFNLYIDSAWATIRPPNWSMIECPTQTIPNTGVWTTVTFGVAGANNEVTYNLSGGFVTSVAAYITGMYQVNAQVKVDGDIPAAQILDIRIKVVDVSGTFYYYGHPGQLLVRSASISTLIPVAYEATFEVQVATTTNALDTDNTDGFNSFSGVRVGR